MLGIFKLFFKKTKKYHAKIKDLKNKISVLNKESKEKDSLLQETEENVLRLEKETKDAVEKMKQQATELNGTNEKLKFIANVVNSLPEKNEAYEKYKKLLREDYMEYANNNDSLASEAAALVKLQNVSRQLQLLTQDVTLLNKTIVAVAGAFSSGKSSFMNSFFTSREIKLPTGMDQTTAISSYIMNGEKSITGFSYKGGRVDIPINVFSLFSYGKIDEFKFNMKQIINHIVFRNEFVKTFDNLCFIDTPGFNPGQETETDYDTATSAVSTANALIWCIDASAGTIKGDELDILFDIFSKNENLKIYIVLNKADLRAQDENLLVMDDVENQLNMKGVQFEGITLYSSRDTFNNQSEEYENFKGISLQEFLESNNIENVQKEKNLLKLVDEVFRDYIDADEQRIEKLENQIRILKILESSYSKISDSKDEQISYYKARIDTKHYKPKSFDADDEQQDEEMFNGIADLKMELKKTVENDKFDIEKAKDLCESMKKAVCRVFGHKLSDIVIEEDHAQTVAKYYDISLQEAKNLIQKQCKLNGNVKLHKTSAAKVEKSSANKDDSKTTKSSVENKKTSSKTIKTSSSAKKSTGGTRTRGTKKS